MGADRFVVLGVARARSEWFREVAHWGHTAALPIEFVKAVSIDEVRVRLRSGRPYSALLVDHATHGLDRDLVDLAMENGTAVVLVGGGQPAAGTELGVSGHLDSRFGRDELLRVLHQVATPVAAAPALGADHLVVRPDESVVHAGRIVAVTGAGGTGRSTVAMALAQNLAADPRQRAMVCLADLALDADLALLHDAGDVVPGIVELVEAHRSGRPTIDDVRALTWWVPERGYHLLLGLRRHRDWTSLRKRSISAALDSLRRSFRIAVADVDADLEGERQTGSFDIEERNALARLSIDAASVVCVVGGPGVHGTHGLLRVTRDLLDHGVPASSIVPVVNRAPRRSRERAELTRALEELLPSTGGGEALRPPVQLGAQRRLDTDLRDGRPTRDGWAAPLSSAVTTLLDRLDDPAPTIDLDEPIAVVPGSLGTWTMQDGEVG